MLPRSTTMVGKGGSLTQMASVPCGRRTTPGWCCHPSAGVPRPVRRDDARAQQARGPARARGHARRVRPRWPPRARPRGRPCVWLGFPVRPRGVTCSPCRATSFGGVFFLISLGSPHVPQAHMGRTFNMRGAKRARTDRHSRVIERLPPGTRARRTGGTNSGSTSTRGNMNPGGVAF